LGKRLFRDLHRPSDKLKRTIATTIERESKLLTKEIGRLEKEQSKSAKKLDDADKTHYEQIQEVDKDWLKTHRTISGIENKLEWIKSYQSGAKKESLPRWLQGRKKEDIFKETARLNRELTEARELLEELEGLREEIVSEVGRTTFVRRDAEISEKRATHIEGLRRRLTRQFKLSAEIPRKILPNFVEILIEEIINWHYRPGRR
jgi:predicted  nucleic acid-binding Zn-ribbon protein